MINPIKSNGIIIKLHKSRCRKKKLREEKDVRNYCNRLPLHLCHRACDHISKHFLKKVYIRIYMFNINVSRIKVNILDQYPSISCLQSMTFITFDSNFCHINLNNLNEHSFWWMRRRFLDSTLYNSTTHFSPRDRKATNSFSPSCANRMRDALSTGMLESIFFPVEINIYCTDVFLCENGWWSLSVSFMKICYFSFGLSLADRPNPEPQMARTAGVRWSDQKSQTATISPPEGE